MSSKRAERALQQLVRETRAQAAPELDWDRLEARLPDEPVPQKLAPERSRLGMRLALWAAAFALTTSALVWIRVGESPRVTADAPDTAELASGPTRGDLLVPGASVTTLAEPRTIEHPERASWTLAPHSHATLVTKGELVVVRLERGSITARIVPSSRPESFAVETADVRVAAHGTVFRVTLDGGAVAVSVEEGSVLVGPRATPGIGKLLAGPSAERFSLSGAPVAEPRRVTAARPAQRVEQPSAEATPTSSVGAAEPPSPEQIALATDRVVELASACFSKRTAASDGVRVTAHTVLSFITAPDGSVTSIQLDPPLAPNVQSCIEEGSAKLRAAPSERGFQGTRVVDLER
jgi:ferric-dicitrate binding protein FerR (iron transport regulator)